MKAKDCVVGTRVGWKQYNGVFYKGKILVAPFSNSNGLEMVVVEWDSYGTVENREISTLIPEAKVVEAEAAALAEKTRMEKDFKRVAAEVKVKLNAAAGLIKEAQALAQTVQREARYMDDASDALQDALDESGWYQSSTNC